MRNLLHTYWPAMFIILIVMSIVWIVGGSQSFQNCVHDTQKQTNAPTAQKSIPDIPSSLAVYRDCLGDFVIRENSTITAFATLVIAIFTIVLAGVTGRQARLTKEALIIDKRAFVFADNYIQNWELDTATNLYNWRFRPRWRNTGSTPTRRLTTYVECEVRNSILPQGYTFTYNEAHIGSGIIGPQTELLGGPTPRGAAITPQDILDAQTFKNKFIYLWGWVKYFDVFPNTPEHTTHFCWLILIIGDPNTFVPNIPGQPPTAGTLAFNYLQHTEGNYTEET